MDGDQFLSLLVCRFWVLPFMMKQLPESASYLIRAGKKEKLFDTLAKVSPEVKYNIDDEIVEAKVIK